ncbi:short-chain dehydrogenase/reductase family 16C member 6-like [Anoplolepis gracilipes]|uniref:short-chain dehydrogenase/reductase family 16C member 6-like n=1 Tax=Anoplolepis gracilipes TaxID=354296 RepID=UPI003BA38330
MIPKIMHILANTLQLFLLILYYIYEDIYYKLFKVGKKSVLGEIVLITGTGHGIGKELAIQYAQLGATVVGLDVNQELNEKTAQEIMELTTYPMYTYQCDVSNREQVFEVTKKVKQEVGDVTILINNAGIMPCYSFLNYTNNQIRRLFDINIIGYIWITQAFLPSMIKKNRGHIVAISSITGLVGTPNLVPYSATKYAVKGFMETLKEELRISSKGKSLIKFSTIFPYMVDTGLCKKPKINKMFSSILTLNSPKDVATQIINAQRQNIIELSIPSFWLFGIAIARLLPYKAQESIKDFFDTGIYPEDS